MGPELKRSTVSCATPVTPSSSTPPNQEKPVSSLGDTDCKNATSSNSFLSGDSCLYLYFHHFRSPVTLLCKVTALSNDDVSQWDSSLWIWLHPFCTPPDMSTIYNLYHI